MRKLILGITFIFVHSICNYAQSFGDPGTSWEYCLMEDYEIPTPYVTAFFFNHVAVIDGKNQIEIYNDRSEQVVDTVSVYQVDDIIYIDDVDSSIVLFDLGLEVGDTVVMQMPKVFNQMYETYFSEFYYPALENPRRRIITDVTTINIGGIVLRQWHFNQACCGGEDETYILFQNTFTERIGFEGFFFPILSVDFLEFNPVSDLAIYQDNDITYSNSDILCITSSIDPEIDQSYLALTPNPTSGQLSIELPDVIAGWLTVRDATGRIVVSTDFDYSELLNIELSSYDPGIYTVEVLSIGGERFIDKIILR